MKILFIARGYPTKDNPMNGNYEAIQAQAMVKQGHQVAFIALSWRSVIHIFKEQVIIYRRIDGIDVYEYKALLPILPKISFGYNYLLYFKKKALRKVYRECTKQFGIPDVVHSHSLFCSEWAVTLKERYNLPLVFTEHWSKLNAFQIGKYTERRGKAYKKADAIITESYALSEKLSHFFGVSSYVIFNMVNDDFFSDVKSAVKKESEFHFIAVGTLCKRKGYDILIEAFKRAHFNRNVYLDILGTGIESFNLQKLIKQFGLQEQIILHGLKTPEQVAQMLSFSNAFVLSSFVETFGIVLIEAMANGLPVVATTCGGPEEFVTEKCGLLVPPGDVRALSDAMLKIYRNKNDYNPEEIRNYCYSSFSQQVIAKKIIEIYDHVISKS